MKAPKSFKGAVSYGADKKLIWFYNTERGPELGEQFKSWKEVKNSMIENGILYWAGNNTGVFALVCVKALEEELRAAAF